MTTKNLKNTEFKLGKRGLLILIFGMSIMLFLSFIFGVVVGKNIDAYPEKFSRNLPEMLMNALSWTSKNPEKIEETVKEKEEESNFDLTFYDTLSKRKGEPTGAIVPETKERGVPLKAALQTTSIPTDIIKDAKTAVSITNKELDKKDTHGTAITNARGSEVKQLSSKSTLEKAKTPPKTKYVIHIVSYREEEKASKLSQKLTTLGYKPKIIATKIPSKGKWFRIVINDFENKEQAQNVIEKLAKNIKGLHCVIINSQ
jgi:cell division protein FtsN